jgi:hypothetical protein
MHYTAWDGRMTDEMGGFRLSGYVLDKVIYKRLAGRSESLFLIQDCTRS